MSEEKKFRNNSYAIQGTIYSKPERKVVSKKKATEGQTFTFPSIILEIKTNIGGREFIELPEFELGKGVNTEGFEVGDKVEISFALSGKKISDTFHKTSAKAFYIRHLDRDYNDTRETYTYGKETKPSVLEPKPFFEPPNPLTEDDSYDNLPF